MKRLSLYISILSLLCFSACELEDKHFDPDAYTTPKIEYLFSRGTMKAIENDYGDTYNYNFRLMGTYLQTIARRSYSNRSNVYLVQNDKGRWENYYVTKMSPLSEMDKVYEYVLTPEEQSNYTPYMETAKIIKAFNTAMASDFFGAMPYKEAFTARNGIYGAPVNLQPKYDSQKDVYYSILNDLKTAAAYLKTATLDESIEVQKSYKAQDIIYKGNLQKWHKFANSLRLRYAMRLSDVDATKTKEVLAEISIADLITENADNAYLRVSGQSTAPDGIWRAITESHRKSNGWYLHAPEPMVNMLTTANDPRLKVFFQPGSDDNGNIYDATQPIVGLPVSADDCNTATSSLTEDQIAKKYGVINSVTYRYNYYLPVGVGITATDVNLLIAEAIQRGLAPSSWGTNVKSFYDKAVILSVQEYYDYYKNSTDNSRKDATIAATDVSETTLSAWLAGSTFNFNPAKALEQIATQRWLNMGILQPYEGWAEYRRTELPLLVDDRDGGRLLNQENAPVRFLYPASEASMNSSNYSQVSDQNYPDIKVWWDVN